VKSRFKPHMPHLKTVDQGSVVPRAELLPTSTRLLPDAPRGTR
jgi:hypothetical protein